MSAIPFQVHNDPSWYTPEDLPKEILAYDTPLHGLSVGSAGKVGLLDLKLAESGGVTRVVRQFQKMPLYIFHPIYLDPNWPSMAFIYLQQSGEGIVDGDRYRLDIDCAAGSAAHITTQAHTKVYRMDNNFATQLINLNVGRDAFVEYLPDPVIPFQGSRFYQRMLLTMDSTASAIVGEILLPGRVARGESHDYELYYTDFEVRTPDGLLLFADRLKLDQQSAFAGSAGLLGSYTVVAALYIITRKTPAGALTDRLYELLETLPDVLAGVSELPSGSGISVRILGHTSATVMAAMHLAWNEARLALVNRPAPDLRKV